MQHHRIPTGVRAAAPRLLRRRREAHLPHAIGHVRCTIRTCMVGTTARVRFRADGRVRTHSDARASAAWRAPSWLAAGWGHQRAAAHLTSPPCRLRRRGTMHHTQMPTCAPYEHCPGSANAPAAQRPARPRGSCAVWHSRSRKSPQLERGLRTHDVAIKYLLLKPQTARCASAAWRRVRHRLVCA